MSKYEWRRLEYTCDQCDTKVMNPDRDRRIPAGWITINHATLGSNGRIENKHFCDAACLGLYFKARGC